jgi:hypothetical protein
MYFKLVHMGKWFMVNFNYNISPVHGKYSAIACPFRLSGALFAEMLRIISTSKKHLVRPCDFSVPLLQ